MLNTVCKLHYTQYGCFDAVPEIAQANCQMLINESLTSIQKEERNFFGFIHSSDMYGNSFSNSMCVKFAWQQSSMKEGAW